MKSPAVINLELNSCMGGITEGFRRAGIEFDMAIDWDKDACDSHEANIGLRPIQMDIRDLVRMAEAGAFRPEFRLFVADPPCTPWSMAGDRKGLDDERDLLRPTMRLIDLLRPTCWLIGNVPGLDKADNYDKVVVPEIIERAARAGYAVDYVSFDAADFGVPQHRVRPFWFGRPARSVPIRWALPTHHEPPVLPGCGLLPHVSCGEALEAAFGPRPWGPEVGRNVRLRRRGAATTDPKKLARAGKKPRASAQDAPGGAVTARQGHGDGTVLIDDIHHPAMSSDTPGNVVRAGSGNGATRAMRLVDPNRPPHSPHSPHRAVSTTVDQAILDAGLLDRPSSVVGTRDELTEPGRHDPATPGSGNSGILLTPEALLVIQGFPKGWVVSGKTKKARMSQIGQAMPPALAEAVGRSVRGWMDACGLGQAERTHARRRGRSAHLEP